MIQRNKRTIWKFPFVVTDSIRIHMPIGAQILHVDVQNEQPCLWALVNPDAEFQRRDFELVGTGHPIGDVRIQSQSHIGTFQMAGGSLVFHMFDMGPRE